MLKMLAEVPVISISSDRINKQHIVLLTRQSEIFVLSLIQRVLGWAWGLYIVSTFFYSALLCENGGMAWFVCLWGLGLGSSFSCITLFIYPSFSMASFLGVSGR